MRELCWEALERLLRAQPLRALAEVADTHGGGVALVGGALRDALLGEPVADLDLVVQERADDFRAAVAAALGRRPVPIGDAFQDTHRMHVHGVQVDIARTLGTLDQDLRRRDFTINAMALPLPAPSPRAALLDPFDGKGDLAAGIVRMTSPSVLQEDPLRLMRAVRYVAALPGFRLDACTRDHVVSGRAGLRGVARERVQYEWGRILASAAWAAGIELARQTGLLAESVGEVERLCWVPATAAAGSDDGTVRLAAVLLDIGDAGGPSGRRLRSWRWPRKLARDASCVAAWASETDADDEIMAGWALRELENAARVAVLWRAGASAAPPLAQASRAALLDLFARRAGEPRWVTGEDLRSWGLPAGRDLGEQLRHLASGQLQRRWADADECRRWARARLRAGSSP